MSEPVFWNEERRKLVVELADKGITRVEIARQIGDGCNRNAVIGILNRLGYRSNSKMIRQVKEARKIVRDMEKTIKRPAKPKPKPAPPKLPAPKLPVEKCFIAGDRQTIPIWDLTPKSCKWPFDPVDEGLTTYCGDEAVPGESFCPAHCREAYNPEGRKRFEKMHPMSRQQTPKPFSFERYKG